MKKIWIFAIFLFFLLPVEVNAGVTNRSEIRALFAHYPTFNNNPNWDLIAQTAKDYKQNVLILETFGHSFARYNSSIVSSTQRDHLAEAIQAAHSRGIEVHVLMLVLGFAPDNPDWRQVDCSGNRIDWLDVCNPDARNRLKSLVEEVATKYDIDGFMYDYIRYDRETTSVSTYCLQQFEDDTGIQISGPADVCTGGQYRNQFMEWRIKTITDLVRDIRSWMTAIKSDLEFSAASFGILFQNGRYYPTYNRRAIGQDTADWVRQGYLDFVSPMTYTTDVNVYRNDTLGNIKYFVGGPEGVVPIAVFNANDYPVRFTPQQVKDEIDACRQVSCDGYAIWRYGGPGDNSGMTPDIRSYLNIIDLPETFSLGNIKAFPDSTQAIISWTTDKPTTSKVEYNSSQLFVWSTKTDYNYQCACQFPYWYVEHVNGEYVENNTLVVYHKIILNNLQSDTTYYYLVQSKDSSGNVTSEVLTFKTSTGNYPATISGTVKDVETKLPISDAVVSCNSYGNVTGSNGIYNLGVPFTGSCLLNASKFGYSTNSTSFSLPTNGRYEYDFYLEPNKVYISGNINMPANISAYLGGNPLYRSQTDVDGNYNLAIIPGIYDIEYEGFNFFIKYLSLNIFSNLNNLINQVAETSNRKSFVAGEINSEQIIQVKSVLPEKISLNSSEIEGVDSYSNLRKNTYYFDSSNNLLYIKITPDLKTDCLAKFECCNNYSIYHDKSCSSGYYCLENICYPKAQCPYDCCENDEMYSNLSCNYPMSCVNRKCVEYLGYWKFDEDSGNTALDSSGLGNNGNINGAIKTSNCKVGLCLNFDGINDNVIVPHSSTLNLVGNFTLEAWVNPLGPWGGDYPGIIAKYWPDGYLLGISNSSSKWCLWLKNAGSSTICSDSTVDFNQWIHLAAVRENNQVKLYVNGNLQSSSGSLSGDITPSNDLEIGTWDNLRFFNGTIDEIKIYKRALNETEIKAHAST